MNKNQLFFGTKTVNSMNDIFTNTTFVINFLLAKTKFQIVALLFFLSTTNFGYSQLATENFNAGIPASWAVTSNLTVTNNWVYTPTGGLSSSGGATVDPASNNTVGSNAEYYLISPQFVTPTNGQIRFYNKQGSFSNRGTTYELRISTANQPDISSFNVVLQTWNETNINVAATSWEEKIVPIPSIPAGIPVYVALVARTNQTGVPSTAGDKWFVDNVRVITACTPVEGITTTLTSTSATINWSHPTATNFGVEVVSSGAGHGTTGTPVTGTTYTASGLLSNTTYDFYIITNCDADTSSSWAGPFPFTTSQAGLNCSAPIVIPSDVSTTPYILNSNLNQFYTTDHPELTTVGSNCFPPVQFAYNQLLGNRIFFNYTPTISGLIDITQAVSVISGGGPNACFNALSSVMVYNSCADVGGSCLAAITTVSNNTTSQISNFYVEAGNTYVIVMSSPYQHTNPGASLCFTFTVSGSSCPAPAPTGTTYNNLTQTSANFSWSNVANLVSSWQYVVLPVASGAPNGSTVVTTTATNINNPAAGLLPATDYNIYVRSVCNGTPGPWAAPVPFRTPCNVASVPYYTGFTPGDASVSCWSQLNLNNDLNFFTFGNNWNSEPVAKCRTQNSNDILVSPQFQLDGVTQKRLRFKFNNYGNWGLIVNNPAGGRCTFEVRLSTTGVGPNNFTTVVLPVAEYTTAYNFVEIFVPIPNVVGNVNIAWILPPGALQEGNWFYVDDVFIEDLPACSEPSYPTVTPGSITSTSATISWTNGFNNTQWELVAQPLGTGTPTGTPAPGAIVNIVNTNPFTITGLNPSTRYEFYMRAVCSSTVQSIWVGPINFNTLCIAQPTPYYESLNTDDVNTKKFCWSVINNSDELTRWRIEETEAEIRALSTMFQPFVSFDDWLVSAPINAVGLKRLRFSHRAVNGIFNPTPRGNVEVLLSSTPDFTTYTTLIPSFDFTNLAYEEKEVLFTGTGTIYIAFRVPPTMTDPWESGIIMIDDVYVEDAPACPNPTFLTVSNVTNTTANFGWNVGYTETQWQVVVQAAGNGVPTGTGVNVNTTSAYSATGLTPDTLYEYYVRAVCGNENSEWVGPVLFKTKCNPLPTPFLETFNSNSSTESCWTIVNGNGDTNDWNLNSTVNPIFGDQMSALFTGSNGYNNDWLITPTLTVQPNQRLRFYYKVYDEFFEEDLKVMLSTNGIATDQFSTILYENSINSSTDANGVTAGSNTITLASAQEAARVRPGDFFYIPGFPFPFPTYVASVNGTLVTMTTNATITQTGVQNVQFEHEAINNEESKEMVINLTDITAPTNINLAFHTPFFPPNPWGYRSQYTFIDNVIVEDIPACSSVINVTSTNLIDTSVTLNWQEVGTATSWEISVQPFGTPAPVGSTLPQYLTTTTTNPKTITGLTPATQYQYYVRAICGGSSQSEWVGPFEFTTRCDFSNVCQYTITTISGNSGQVTRSVNVMQNGVVVQELEFPGFGQTIIDYTVFLCRGVAFDLYWDGLGSGVQYSQAQIIVRDELNNVVWTSPLGLGTVNTNIYSGFASCGVVTCPQPTNTTVSNQGVFSWSPGGTETQWEVFVQPLNNGTLPQSGTLVNSPTYTPIASDFTNSTSSTYEYFVRAICGPTNKSYWSGPKVFVRNDEPTTAVSLQVNTGSVCDVSGVDVSFIGATPSATPTSCGGINGGDVWFDFVATSKIHTIELSDFEPGNYYTSSFEGPWPKIMMSLYEVLPNGSLVEKGCSENNSFVANYSTELVVGTTYKIRLKLDSAISNNKKFHICVTTPTDLCDLNAFNNDFEKLPMQGVTGVPTIINAIVVPGWRVNTQVGQLFFQEQNNSLNVTPYSGGQCVQLIHDNASFWNPSDPNIKGLYKDFDTSEILKMDYSFASATRSSSTTIQLFAGPPAGPFTLVTEHTATSLVWQLIQGNYIVPPGQTTTRFIFRVKNYIIGHILDAANFRANTDIEIATANTILDCTTTSMDFDANGVGVWEAEVNNPASTSIASPNSGSTAVSGFTVPGNYIFHWKTRYCDKTITITKQGNTEMPVVVNPTLYCLNATASPLTATVSTGNTVQWYTQAEGGVGFLIAPIPTTTEIGNSQVFYASSLDGNGCEGVRSQIVVQVDDLPTATISGTTTICSGETTVITFTGTANAIVTYTINGGSNQTITLDATGVAFLTSAALTADTTYALVSVASGITTTCSQTQSGSAVVTVNSLPTATISGTTSICSGETTEITFNGTANALVSYTINGGSTQTITLDSNGAASITTPALTATSTYALVSVASGTSTCSQVQAGSVEVTVNALPTASISGTTSICSGATTVITFNGTPNALVTYTINGGSNQSITLDATGVALHTSAALTADTTFALVSVASGTTICSQVQAGSAVVTVNALPTASISGTASICSGTTSDITFTGTPNAIVSYTINGGSNQTITLDATGVALLTSSALTIDTTFELVSVASGTTACSQAQIGSAVVTVNALPTASISGTISICSGATTVITFNGTANAIVSYTINGGSNQTITLDANGAASITTPALTASSTYALASVASGTSTCSQAQTGSAVVTVNALPTASISGTISICSGATTVITFNGTPNALVTYTINGGSNQSITLDATGVALLTSTALIVDTTFALVSVASGTTICSQVQTGSAVVTVNALPTASISGTASICSGETTVITFTGTANANVTYTVNGGSNQTITLDANGTESITTPALTASSTYTLVSVASGTLACSQAQIGSAVVTVNALPTATISGTASICTGATTEITFNGTPNAIVTYTINGGSNQTITLETTGVAVLTSAALTVDTTYAIVSVASGTSACSQAQSGSAVVTVNALPTATISGTTTICSGSTAVITFTGTANAIVTYTVNEGSNQTVTLDSNGNASITTSTLTASSTYTLVSVASGITTTCSQAQLGSAVVTVNALPTASISGTTSICSGSTAVITFNGTANAIVTYTINGGSNQTITLDANGTGSITTPALTATSTYALVSVASAVSACSQAQTGLAVVTVNALPTVTISGTASICSGATTAISFTGTANAIVTYTVNGGANQTITLDANGTGSITTPALTATSTYALVSVASAVSACSQAQIGSAVITVNALPTVTISGTASICSGATTAISFTGTANAIVTYSVNGGSNQTITLDTNGNASITTPTLIANSTYALVSVASGISACSQTQTGLAAITIEPELTFEITASCENSMLVLKETEANINTTGATYTWTQGATTVGTNAIFNVDEYLAQNSSLTLPLQFSLSLDLNGCIASQNFTVENNPCRIIPRGISPNNDTLNDTFDLTGFGVQNIIIFNRYGTKVFSYSGIYTDQWRGQSNDGDELPDGTYFYSIHLTDGINKTGWVYINREY